MLQVSGTKITYGSSSPTEPQSEQEISRRLATRLTRKTFTQYHPAYFAGVSCNSPLSRSAQGKGVKHRCYQKKGKVEETAWDLPSTAGILQLYVFVHFLTEVLVVPLKTLAGTWTLEWEGGYKERMSQPCKPATDTLLQCVVPSWHSVPVLLDGKLIWERKNPVKLCSRRSKSQTSENHTWAFVRRKERKGVKGMAMERQSQVWEDVIWAYTGAEEEHDRTSALKEKEKKSKSNCGE